MSGGAHQAYFLYEPPTDFVRPSVVADTTSSIRIATIQVGIVGQERSYDVILKRPPVVFAHGLWSAPPTWRNAFSAISQGLDARWFAMPWDYSDAAADSIFSLAERVFDEAILPAMNLARSQGFASSNVDWVGHSMGGLVPRAYYRIAEANVWRTARNFGRGDIRRLILINSPQEGSPWAEVVWGVLNDPVSGPWAYELMDGLGAVGEALLDLRVNSSALRRLGATPIPSWAIYGTGGGTVVGGADVLASLGLSLIAGPEVQLLAAITGFAPVSMTFRSLFGSEQNDVIVGESSQKAGLAPTYQSAFSGVDSIHTSVTGSSAVEAEVERLLNAPIAAFAGALPAVVGAPAPYVPPPAPVVSRAINITAPTMPAQVQPGQSLLVSLAAAGGFTPTWLSIGVTGGPLVQASTATMNASVVIPQGAIDEVTLVAIARDAVGRVSTAQPVVLIVTQPHPLQAIRISPSSLMLDSPQRRARLKTTAVFADGVERDISRSRGTAFVVDDPTVLAVDDRGSITPLRQGTAIVTAQYGGMQATIPVVVKWPALAPFGTGTSGAGAYTPVAVGIGAPSRNNATFAIEISSMAGGAPTALVVGGRPGATTLLGSTSLYVDPASFIAALYGVATGTVGNAGIGVCRWGIPIPNSQSLVGWTFFSQGLALDGAAETGLSASQGLAVTIAPL